MNDALLEEVKRSGDCPDHIAVIMDGNGRWAKQRRKPRIFGHQAGMKSVREVIEACGDVGVKYLTLYAFSSENWNRPRSEVAALMKLLKVYTLSEREELREQGVQVRAIGRIDELEETAREAIRSIEEYTRDGDRMVLNLAINYGGRSEIVDAVRALSGEVARGKLLPRDINEHLFARFLYTSNDPDPDLLIRTSGEMRISNFLLYQMAYTEIYVTDVLWPDFRREHLYEAILDYQKRERRFGKVSSSR
ncbi:MAG: isoprenyl transferase [Candidatus Glassbacteria bacterium]